MSIQGMSLEERAEFEAKMSAMHEALAREQEELVEQESETTYTHTHTHTYSLTHTYAHNLSLPTPFTSPPCV